MRVRSCLRSNSIFPICSIRNWISGNSLLTCSITYIFFLFIHEYIFRYSIWLDSKLRLQLYPLLILEYFMWWKSYKYVLSNHYDRHCVWEEVTQNKRLNKYNHTTIDHQFSFYHADGLKRINASDPNKFLPNNKIQLLELQISLELQWWLFRLCWCFSWSCYRCCWRHRSSRRSSRRRLAADAGCNEAH